ncbi:CBS domain-containing protein [Georgenia thermotolerans]|uniref:CBS domain-containing protein n=1 Tax=Georgenia thermotolerans TaxID=527326 RepID=A0A7J5UND1_9MICO|nr:CBS domain-containing protein [Georgenia thermotolerans]KAE8763869.1 CBS domain-containing protein [Georgenia thermotolerans]
MDLPSAVTQPVSGLMSSPVAAVDAGATLREVAEAMAANEIGAVTVLADGHLAGIVSERDVVTHLADGAHPDHLLAADMFTAEFVSAAPEDRLLDVARRMVAARVRHVPVLEDGQAVGMVSMRDVAAVLVAALG